jgi:hypothetical protein
MDANLFRKLAFRTLRLAELTDDADEAAKLRLTAADYLDKAATAPGPSGVRQQQQQQQQQQPGRDDHGGRKRR